MVHDTSRLSGDTKRRRSPLFLDLPIGDQAPAVLAKWAANAPLAFIDQYVLELQRYRAISIDVGDQDGLRVDAGKLQLNAPVDVGCGRAAPGLSLTLDRHAPPFGRHWH